MKQKKGRHPGTESRRKTIINAALACFAEIGFSETSMEDIRRKSGASTGSIYHHFKSKEQLAAEVYLAGICNYQEGLIQALEGQTDMEAGVRALVAFHLQWIMENVEWARYLFQKRHSVFMAAAEAKIHSMNKEFSRKLHQWFMQGVNSGAVRMLPADIVAALIIGPCMEFTRQYLAGHNRTDREQAATLMGDAVWRALSQDCKGSRRNV